MQLVEVHVGYAWSRSTRGHGVWRVAAVLGAALMVALAIAPQPAVAQPSRGPRMLHLPMRWCVLEGSPAARRPTAAVLERIRRGSSILAKEAGITLQSAITSALGKEVGFPVIADPRPRVGRLGDVVVPVESTLEYRLVSERCEQAWRRIEQAAGPGSGLGAIARGPTSVIIRDFVTRSGAPYPAVWGYGFSVSSAGDYCAAANPIVRSASGGTLMVVDSSDGQPSPLLDRRLIAHEVGHILRLGHGNGFDDRGSVSGRIDKFCDDTENPDVVPGSLMSASLSFERVTPWQRILPRTVAARHPAVVADQPIIRVLPPRIRSELLQRLSNDGSRVVDRLLPPGNRNLTPLERLRSAGVLGASVWDALGDARGRDATNPSDLQGLGLSVDGESGDTTVWWEPVGDPAGPGVDQVFDGVVDSDDDPSTGGTGDPTDPSDPGGGPFIDWGAILGAELYFQVSTSEGESDVKAWTWDDLVSDWQVVDPPPSVTFGDFFGEDSPARRSKTVELTLPASAFGVSERFSMGGRLRTINANGRQNVDRLPEDVDDGVRESMTLATPEYPVCAVNRGAEAPGTAQPSGPASVEVFGFGDTGRVSLWLDAAQQPLARRDYWEVPDDTWPWVTEVDLPANTAPGMHMMQVAFDGSGMTANCPLVVGDAELPDFDAPAE